MAPTKILRVLLISPGLVPHFGGSAISEASLGGALTSQCELTVLCREGRWDESFGRKYGLKEVTLYRPFEIFKAWLSRSAPFNEVIKSQDIVHLNGHWKWENFFIAKLCLRHSVPYILQPRGMFLIGHRKRVLKRIFNALLGNFIMRHATRVIALSEFEKRQFRNLPIRSDQVKVLPNGIPVSKTFKETPQAQVPFFLYLGRVESRKNLLFLIDAFFEYRQGNGLAELYLVGPVERGYDAAIRQRAIALGLENQVKLLPPVYDESKWALMGDAIAVVYPTIEEPFGRVPFESVACGTPPIVPEASGSAEYLGKYLHRCIYRDGDARSLAEVMTFVEKNRTGRLIESVAAARDWIAQCLDWKKISRELIAEYRALARDLPEPHLQAQA